MSDTQPAPWRKPVADALLGVCLVATVFSVIVGSLTLLTHRQWRSSDPLNDDALLSLRTRYAEGARDAETTAALRAADLAARQAYFSLRQRVVTGGWMIVGGVILAISARCLRARTRKPSIPPAPPRCEGMQAMEVAQARGAIVGAGVMLAVVSIVAALSARSPLEDKAESRSSSAKATADKKQKAEIESKTRLKTEESQLPTPNAQHPTSNEPEPRTKDYGLRTKDQGLDLWFPSFRGVGGSGLTDYGNLPVSWNVDEDQNILWRHDLPLPGWASPVVSGKHVIVIGANADRREVTCVHADSGERLWSTTVPPHDDATNDYQPDTMDERWDTLVFAGATPAVTKTQAFALFSNGQFVALDLKTGDVQWNFVPAKTSKNPFGLDNSLLTYKDSVIVVFEGDARFIARYDAATGREIWKTERKLSSWASPILVETNDKQALVVLLSYPDVTAWDAETGAVVWSQKVLRKKPDYVVGPSPVHVDGRIFVNCQNSGIYALSLADGSLLWSLEQLPDRHGFADGASMVSDDKHLFQFFEFFLTCINMENGNVVKQVEVDAFSGYASPAADGGRLYLFGDTKTLIVDADPETDFTVLGTGELAENVDASPAITDGRIFVRTDMALYAIGGE